MAAFK